MVNFCAEVRSLTSNMSFSRTWTSRNLELTKTLYLESALPLKQTFSVSDLIRLVRQAYGKNSFLPSPGGVSGKHGDTPLLNNSDLIKVTGVVSLVHQLAKKIKLFHFSHNSGEILASQQTSFFLQA